MKLSVQKIREEAILYLADNWLVFTLALAAAIKFWLVGKLIGTTWPSLSVYGTIFDFLTALLLFAPALFFKEHKKTVALFTCGLIALLIIADLVYYDNFFALPSAGLWNLAGQLKTQVSAVVSSFNPWYLLFFLDLALATLFSKKLTSLISKCSKQGEPWRGGAASSAILTLVAGVALTLLLVFKPEPSLIFTINNGYDTKAASQEFGLVLGHLIDVYRFIQSETTHLSATEKKAVSDWVQKNKPVQSAGSLSGVAKGKNVIIIQVESLGAFAMNGKVNGREVTPNLDKLAAGSYYFPNERFIIGGGHTSDTDFVANSSYFPMDDAAVFVRYGRDAFMGLPKILSANGYSAYAYHAYNRNFWNRDIAFGSLGFQKFFAAENYKKGTKLNMGLNDGDFLSQTEEYIKVQPRPSFSYVITLSSHVPFYTNKDTQALGIDPGKYPYFVGGYLEDINYTDRMIGRFLEKLKTDGLYDDSLIVVYGDHTPVLPAFDAGTIDYDPNTNQGKEVPLIIKLPGQSTGKTEKNVGNHLDIMPTILDVLGIKYNGLMFGQSLLTTNESYQSCPNQVSVLKSLGVDCDASLAIERSFSAKIIRYNLFNILPK